MINFFKNDDHGFAFWLRDNPSGYVFDDFGGINPQLKKLHQSRCKQVRSPNSISAKTHIRKVCCASLDELVSWIDKNFGPEKEGYFPCEHCHPFRSTEDSTWN